MGLIPGPGRSPGGGHSNPLQYSCLENLYGQRSLAGYSPCSRKELDTTEHGQRGKTTSRYWIKTKKAIYKKSREPLDDINPVNT